MLTWPTNPDMPRANKQGVTFKACRYARAGKQTINITLTDSGKDYAQFRARDDMQRFLLACKGKTQEAQAIADRLGWSRDIVLIYKARAEKRGHVVSCNVNKERALQRAREMVARAEKMV